MKTKIILNEESQKLEEEKRKIFQLMEEIGTRLSTNDYFGGIFWRAVNIANFAIKHMPKTERKDRIEFLRKHHKLNNEKKSITLTTEKAEKSIKELIIKKGGAKRFFETEDALSDFIIPTEEQINSFKNGYFDACAIASSFNDDNFETIEAFKTLIGNIYMIIDEPLIDNLAKLEKIVFAVYAQRANIEALDEVAP